MHAYVRGTFYIQYETLEELGEGAFGKALKCRRRRDNQIFVVKIMHESKMSAKAIEEVKDQSFSVSSSLFFHAVRLVTNTHISSETQLVSAGHALHAVMVLHSSCLVLTYAANGSPARLALSLHACVELSCLHRVAALLCHKEIIYCCVWLRCLA